MHFLWPRSQINNRLQLIQMQRLTAVARPGNSDDVPLVCFSSFRSNFKIELIFIKTHMRWLPDCVTDLLAYMSWHDIMIQLFLFQI